MIELEQGSDALTPTMGPQADSRTSQTAKRTPVENMRRCARFDSCSAPICPLDPDWAKRDMLPGDGTCTWLLEIAKAGPESQYVPENIRQDIAEMLPRLLPAVGLAPLRAQIKRAAESGSRRASAMVRLREGAACAKAANPCAPPSTGRWERKTPTAVCTESCTEHPMLGL